MTVKGSTSLTFTITNPAAGGPAFTGVAFSDTLPPGLVTPNQTFSACGGTVTVSGNVISLAGATVANGTPCTFGVNVTALSAGVMNNLTSAVTSTNGGTGNTAAASVTAQTPTTATPVPPSFYLALIGLLGLLTWSAWSMHRRRAA
jgi:uncharacterized repeat protein (TIGR01451 family)